MELKELSAIWNNTDSDLEKNVTINRSLLKEISVLRIRTHLAGIKWYSYFQILTNIIFLVFLTGFIFDYMLTIRYGIPAFIVFAATVTSIFTGCMKLILFYKVDAHKSVLANQKNVERLKYYDLLEKNLLYFIIPFFSAAFMIIFVKEFMGFELYALGYWLSIYIASSAVIAAIIVFFLKKFPNRNLLATIAFLKEIRDMAKNN